MPGKVVLGLQWGDEGKGKLVDYMAEKADAVVRFQGGGNAGHTVVVDGRKTILHHLPSGMLHGGKRCIIGAGVVVDPVTLEKEFATIREIGLQAEGRLTICFRAHLVLPHHKIQDLAAEKRRAGSKIGTTGRGIGPAYGDKMARIGIRAGDLLDHGRLEPKVDLFCSEKKLLLGDDWTAECEPGALMAFLQRCSAMLKPMIGDGYDEVTRLLADGKDVLFEGAQGSLLDIDLGTYPFVTSSSTTIGGLFHGAGVSFRQIGDVIGVVKAYITRVGSGPFPTEDLGQDGERIRKQGNEFGSTTGRPRRCGWFDAPACAYSAGLNGVSGLAVTKLDVLSGFDEIRICTGYRIGGKTTRTFDPRLEILEAVEPVYETLPGWRENIGKARKIADLPSNCRKYINRLETLAGAPVVIASVGPERNQIIEVR